MQNEAMGTDAVVKLVPGGDQWLAHLSDRELLANTRGLVGKANQVFAALLAHLVEVEARGLHRTRACASLYTYCIYELRLSEDAAARRSGAAKWVKRFPVLLEAIAKGELHLTGVLLLGPHLTGENILEVLGRAKFRTKKELGKLVRELHPLPLVADLIEPLRPEPRPLRRPTWEQFVTSMSPAVRELPPGERPCDWVNDAADACEVPHSSCRPDSAADGAPPPNSPVRLEPLHGQLAPVTAPQQYQMQFSTTEEHVQLVDRAKALLARQAPGKSLGEVHLQAMKLLVRELEKEKFALSAQPRRRTAKGEAGNERRSQTARREAGQLTGARRHGRYIPAEVRRMVFERDDARCTYVDERGERCRETSYLELHHRQPFEQGGAQSVANLTLHCRAHNELAAELDFGREHMAERRDRLRHESLSAELRTASSDRALP